MKKSVLFLLFACCFFVLQAAAQQAEYTITELELTRLEKVSKNWATNRRDLLLQVQSLQARLMDALKTSSELNEQLKREREVSKSLRTSFGEYERETAAEIQQKQIQIDKLKEEKHQYAVAGLCAVIGALFLLIIGFFLFKLKIL